VLHTFITIYTQPKPLCHHLYCFLSVDIWFAAARTRRAICWSAAAIKCQNMNETTLYYSTYVLQFVGFFNKNITSDFGTHIFDWQYSYGMRPNYIKTYSKNSKITSCI
jgi:hypothetical protein